MWKEPVSGRQFPIDRVWIRSRISRAGRTFQIGDDCRCPDRLFQRSDSCLTRPPAGSRGSALGATKQGCRPRFAGLSRPVRAGWKPRHSGFCTAGAKPREDWSSSETLEEFGKGLRRVSLRRREFTPGEVDFQKASPAAPEKHTFHYCIYNKPRRAGQPDTEDDRLARALITAEVSVEKAADGIARFSCKLNQGHDYLDVVEVEAATFLVSCFENGRVSPRASGDLADRVWSNRWQKNSGMRSSVFVPG